MAYVGPSLSGLALVPVGHVGVHAIVGELPPEPPQRYLAPLFEISSFFSLDYLHVLEKTTIGSEADVVVEENLPHMGAEPKGGKEKRRRLLRQPNTEAH